MNKKKKKKKNEIILNLVTLVEFCSNLSLSFAGTVNLALASFACSV